MKLNWVERYKNGDCENVWTEITNGQYLVKYQEYKKEINTVIDLTISNIRYNAELIYNKLIEIEYPFKTECPLEFKSSKGTTPPSILDNRLSKIDLSLPLILKVFYSEIGGIDFRRNTEKQINNSNLQKEVFENYYTDPLHIWSSKDTMSTKYLNSIFDQSNSVINNQITIDLCPDFYLKDNVSGSGGYQIIIQSDKTINPNLDMLELNLKEFTFIDYIRRSFENGGFLGFAFYENLNLTTKEFIKYLTTGIKKI